MYVGGLIRTQVLMAVLISKIVEGGLSNLFGLEITSVGDFLVFDGNENVDAILYNNIGK